MHSEFQNSNSRYAIPKKSSERELENSTPCNTQALPELLTLIKGIMRATRNVFSALTLLIIFMYVFGLLFSMLYKSYIKEGAFEAGEQYFSIVLLWNTGYVFWFYFVSN